MSTELNLVYDLDTEFVIDSFETKKAYQTHFRGWLRTRCAEAQNWRCCYCGHEMNINPKSKKCVTLEHVTPRSMGGKDTYENCAAACYSCNNKRENNPLTDDMQIIDPNTLRDPKQPLGARIRRLVKLVVCGAVSDLEGFDKWFNSTPIKPVNREYILEETYKLCGIRLT